MTGEKRPSIWLSSPDPDSVDGTFLKYAPDTNWARMQRWFEAMETHPVMRLAE